MRARTGHTSIILSKSRTPTFSTPSGNLIKCYASLLEKEKGGDQQCGAAPALPLDTATAVSDTLIVARHGQFQCAEGGVSAVA